ncbi:hypothetical protein MKW92_024684 [Papaver armeniacum]|nr:hypothetical protein MKW92_024684 [Papaver armeniacum]
MHYADGITTPCKDVLPDQFKGCSDLITTHFLNRMIKAENPDFIVFTAFMNKPEAQKDLAPALAYFHIPLPEYTSQGMLKPVFVGHDHINDIYGELIGIHLCYAGGFKLTTLEKTGKGGWGYVNSIRTWKRLDDEHLTPVDAQILWTKSSVSKSL